ncbi:hypothetical protein KCP74_04955 [Salmonella enterica subsp. enterica]|nr:hypothetical protein KCP74_04955 [Salmonella enterica subsp. enterica]
MIRKSALQQGELDLGDDCRYFTRSGCIIRRCLIFEVRLVLAPDHPLASKTQIMPKI